MLNLKGGGMNGRPRPVESVEPTKGGGMNGRPRPAESVEPTKGGSRYRKNKTTNKKNKSRSQNKRNTRVKKLF